MSIQPRLRLLTTREVAEYLGYHIDTVLEWLREGSIKGHKSGSGRNCRWRVRPQDLDSWLRARSNTR